MKMNARISKAVEEAQQAFWLKLAENFPEVKSGDFPPGATMQFDAACEKAAQIWVEGNFPLQGMAVTVVASDTCYPILYHAPAVLDEDGIVTIIGDYTFPDGTKPKFVQSDSGAIDILEVKLPDGTTMPLETSIMQVKFD